MTAAQPITERGVLTLDDLGHDPERERPWHRPAFLPSRGIGLCGARYISRGLTPYRPDRNVCVVCDELWEAGYRPIGWSP